MKKALFTLLMLATTLTIQAQTSNNKEKTDINTLAKQYAKSEDSATLKIPTPQHALILECNEGYIIEAKGKHDGQEYDITITHLAKGSSETNISITGRQDCNLEQGTLFDDADEIILTKSPQQNSVTVVKGGDNGYRVQIKQRSEAKETWTTYRERNSSWDFNIPFAKQKKTSTSNYKTYSRFEFNILSDLKFGVGLVSAHSQAPGMDVEFGNAGWEFILNNLCNFYYTPFKRTHLSLGLGVDWRNYRMRGENRFLKEDNMLTVAPYPSGAEIDFSRIKVFSITLDLMLFLDINKHVSIGAGAAANFNTHASIKTRYTLGSGEAKENFKETNDNIHHKPVTFDYKAELIISPVVFYFKYSPVNTLDTDYGPEFKSISAGVCIGL